MADIKPRLAASFSQPQRHSHSHTASRRGAGTAPPGGESARRGHGSAGTAARGELAAAGGGGHGALLPAPGAAAALSRPGGTGAAAGRATAVREEARPLPPEGKPSPDRPAARPGTLGRRGSTTRPFPSPESGRGSPFRAPHSLARSLTPQGRRRWGRPFTSERGAPTNGRSGARGVPRPSEGNGAPSPAAALPAPTGPPPPADPSARSRSRRQKRGHGPATRGAASGSWSAEVRTRELPSLLLALKRSLRYPHQHSSKRDGTSRASFLSVTSPGAAPEQPYTGHNALLPAQRRSHRFEERYERLSALRLRVVPHRNCSPAVKSQHALG